MSPICQVRLICSADMICEKFRGRRRGNIDRFFSPIQIVIHCKMWRFNGQNSLTALLFIQFSKGQVWEIWPLLTNLHSKKWWLFAVFCCWVNHDAVLYNRRHSMHSHEKQAGYELDALALITTKRMQWCFCTQPVDNTRSMSLDTLLWHVPCTTTPMSPWQLSTITRSKTDFIFMSCKTCKFIPVMRRMLPFESF